MNKDTTVQLHTGNAMPVIGLGTWKLTEDTAGTIVNALEMGYPMIDTSGDYGTQPGIGQGLKQSGLDRDAFYIVTKVEETDDAYEATKKNLQELDIEYADLMLIHRPPQDGVGQELWQGLMQAKREGLTKDIGVSNYSIEQLKELADSTKEAPTVNQIEWSPFGHSQSMLEYANDTGMVIQAYSPLTRNTKLNMAALDTIADAHGKSPAQIVIRWNLQLGVVPIPKASKVEHLQENIEVFDFELSEEDMATLTDLNTGYSALGSKLQYE